MPCCHAVRPSCCTAGPALVPSRQLFKPMFCCRTEARTFLPKGFVNEENTMTGLVDQANNVFKLAGVVLCSSAQHARLHECCRLAVSMITQLVARWAYTLSSSCTQRGSAPREASLQAVGQPSAAPCPAEGTGTHAALLRAGDLSNQHHPALPEQEPSTLQKLHSVQASDSDAVLKQNHAVAECLCLSVCVLGIG